MSVQPVAFVIADDQLANSASFNDKPSRLAEAMTLLWIAFGSFGDVAMDIARSRVGRKRTVRRAANPKVDRDHKWTSVIFANPRLANRMS
jgi:hypothetical protein